MEYIHIKNLEKYLPGYADRTLAWLKLYFRNTTDQKNHTKHTGIFNDVEFQNLDEICKYRFISLACMEGFLGKPVPLTDRYAAWMGWNTKKLSKPKTLQMLQPFIQVTGEPVTQSRLRVDKEKSRVKESKYTPEFENFWKLFKGRWNPKKGAYGTFVKGSKSVAFGVWEELTSPEQQKATEGAEGSADEFCPDCYRWLREKRWER